jgi:ABC-type multidrug transport system fused ATPase/permease subunit
MGSWWKQGTHDQLISRQGHYYELWQQQQLVSGVLEEEDLVP